MNRVEDKLDQVALLAEGVDRNDQGLYISQKQFLSPSSRRAWIEMRPRWA